MTDSYIENLDANFSKKGKPEMKEPKTIKIKDKKLIQIINEIQDNLNAARIGIDHSSTKLKHNTNVLFKTIAEHFPETKGWNINYNHDENEIRFLHRSHDDDGFRQIK